MPRPPHHEPCNHEPIWDEVYIHNTGHNTLRDREEADAHPISSITGLEDKLKELEVATPEIVIPEEPVTTGNLLVRNDLGELVDSGRCCSTIPTTEEVSTLARTVETRTSTYIHVQEEASTMWRITHNLDKIPSVIVTDSEGVTIIGEVVYQNMNEVTIVFSSKITGKAYLH